jgi:hypothetical protein
MARCAAVKCTQTALSSQTLPSAYHMGVGHRVLFVFEFCKLHVGVGYF